MDNYSLETTLVFKASRSFHTAPGQRCPWVQVYDEGCFSSPPCTGTPSCRLPGSPQTLRSWPCCSGKSGRSCRAPRVFVLRLEVTLRGSCAVGSRRLAGGLCLPRAEQFDTGSSPTRAGFPGVGAAPLQASGFQKQHNNTDVVVCGSGGPAPRKGGCWQRFQLFSSKSCNSWSLFLLLSFLGTHSC